MLKMKESGKTGAVGSVLMSYSQPNRIRTLGGGVFHKYLGFTNNICSNHIFDPQLIDKVPGGTAIDFISGCSILVSNEVMNIVGLLDDEYFGYWEDADWGQRMKRQGYSLTYAPQSIVYHKEGQSSSLYAGSYFSTFNCFRFYRKYYRTLLPLVIVNRLIFIFLVAIKNNSFSYLKGSLRAYRDFLKTLL
jgi:GT2 family glycosyltransferase